MFVLKGTSSDPLCWSVCKILALWSAEKTDSSMLRGEKILGGTSGTHFVLGEDSKKMCFRAQWLWHMNCPGFRVNSPQKLHYHPNMLFLSNETVIGCLSMIAGILLFCSLLFFFFFLFLFPFRFLSYSFLFLFLTRQFSIVKANAM